MDADDPDPVASDFGGHRADEVGLGRPLRVATRRVSLEREEERPGEAGAGSGRRGAELDVGLSGKMEGVDSRPQAGIVRAALEAHVLEHREH